MSNWTITVKDGDKEYEFVDLGGTLIDSLLAFGYPAHHQCRNGDCGECKTYLVEGSVHMLPYSRDALSKEERAAGLILACRASPESNVVLSYGGDLAPAPSSNGADKAALVPVRTLEEARKASQDIEGTVLSIEKRPPGVFVMKLSLEEKFKYRPGQYADLALGDMTARSYSMASAMASALNDGRRLEFHIRHYEGGAAGVWLDDNAEPGTKVHLRGPFGEATLDKAEEGSPLLLICAGVGFAPMKSIAHAALCRRPDRSVKLLLFARTPDSIYQQHYIDELTELYPGFSCSLVFTRANGDDPEERKKFYVDKVLSKFAPDLSNTTVFCAGPPALVESVRETCRLTPGRKPASLHCDEFVQSGI